MKIGTRQQTEKVLHINPKLKKALDASRQNFPKIYFDDKLACQFIRKINEQTDMQVSFVLAVAASLRYYNIKGRATIHAWQKLAGTYYQKRNQSRENAFSLMV